MPDEQPTTPDPRRNWRDIAQSAGHRRSSTGIARRRRFVVVGRWLGIGAVLLLAGGAAAFGVYSLSSPESPSARRDGQTLARITFRTDGVLNERWFASVCALRPGDPVSDIDIQRVKAAMEGHGQVREARVMLRMPDELVVEVRERIPLLRARVASEEGRTRTVLISREGHVYEGANYSPKTVAALPFLGGVTFRKEDGRIVPVRGMDVVADLLDTARRRHPEIYAGWRVVSCERFKDPASPGALISVASRHADEIVFAPSDFRTQVDRLADVLYKLAARPKPPEIARVDLSLPGQAIVEEKLLARADSRRR